MNQAQDAIDAARRAGAEQYAPSELAAAVDALRRAQEAANQRDYRLALSLAIDSRDGAQRAAKLAVDARSRARGAAERSIAEVDTLLTRVRDRMRDGSVARLSPRAQLRHRSAVNDAARSLQEARAALSADDYTHATKATEGIAARLQAALNEIDEARQPGSPRKQR